MGVPHTKANMRTAILIIVSLAIATASMETIVPEETLYELDDDLLQARQTLDQMKSSGKSDAECRKLVQESKNEITTNCKTSQISSTPSRQAANALTSALLKSPR